MLLARKETRAKMMTRQRDILGNANLRCLLTMLRVYRAGDYTVIVGASRGNVTLTNVLIQRSSGCEGIHSNMYYDRQGGCPVSVAPFGNLTYLHANRLPGFDLVGPRYSRPREAPHPMNQIYSPKMVILTPLVA